MPQSLAFRSGSFDCGDDLHAVEELWRCSLEFGPRVRVRLEVPVDSAALAAGDGDCHAGRLFSFYADVRRDHCRSDAVAALAAFEGMQSTLLSRKNGTPPKI